METVDLSPEVLDAAEEDREVVDRDVEAEEGDREAEETDDINYLKISFSLRFSTQFSPVHFLTAHFYNEKLIFFFAVRDYSL